MKTKLFLTAFTLLTLFAAQDRACAATRTWTGGGLDPLWSNTANWSGGIRPAAADDVVFPTGTPQPATVNNWTGTLHSITFGVGGYSIVQAQSHDAAAKLFGKSHPHLQMMPGGWIEIVEIMPMPDM